MMKPDQSPNILIKIGVIALLAFGGVVILLRAIAVGVGVLAAGGAFGPSAPSAELAEMEAGFKEISSEWDAWSDQWGESDHLTVQGLGAIVAAYHTTDEEAQVLYESRARFFHEAGSNPALHHLCRDGAFSEVPIGRGDVPDLVTSTTARIMGRAFARFYHEHAPWRPPFDLNYDDEVWVELDRYLQAQDRDFVLDTMIDLAEEQPVDAANVCRAFSELYRLSVRDSSHPIANGTLLEFVRALDLLGADAHLASR